MELPLQPALVPPHIDGFVFEGDLRLSRFAARTGGQLTTAAPQHHRAELELNLASKGRAQYLVGERHVELPAQHMLWIAPRQNRLVIDVSEDFRCWVLVFRARLVRRALTTDDSLPLRRPARRRVLIRRLSATQLHELSALYRSLPVGKGRDVFNTGLAYALTRSWLAFREAERGDLPREVHPAVRQAAWLLREESGPLDNRQLAARCGLSAQRLSRLFKRQMGTSLGEFRNRQRLERLLRELAQPQAPSLMQAALDAGFGSYAQFHRWFRRHMGVRPSEYVRRQG